MSTPVSRRLRLALAAIATVGALYVVVLACMQAIAHAVEASGVVYPYQQEDWLRYLVPGLWPAADEDMLLLTGPSTARENLVQEGFESAFPGVRVMQGALSLGTLADVTASLEYVERVYGASALPDRIVLGVSARFLAELPARRPFALGLNRYSRWYRAKPGGDGGLRLERKSAVRGAVDHARFLATKQTPRYLAALYAVMARVTRPASGVRAGEAPPGRLETRIGRFFLPGRMIELGPHGYFLERISPTKYVNPTHIADAGLDAWMDEPDSFWADVHAWDPGADSIAVRRRALRLIRFAADHNIDVRVVNLPERSISRVRYVPGFDARFEEYLRAVFDPLPVLDLRCMLADDEFRDLEHALPGAATRITRHAIRFMKRTPAPPTDGEAGPAPAADGGNASRFACIETL